MTAGSEQVSGILFLDQPSKVNIPTSPAECRQAEEMEADGETMTSGGGERENLRFHGHANRYSSAKSKEQTIPTN